MEEERDIVTFSDDEGNEFELEVIDYFDYEDEEYAVLINPEQANDEEAEDTEVYIMKIVVDGEYEEFVAADDDKMDALSAIVEQRLEEMDGCCDCECDCDCDCEEEHEHHHCDCGCEHE